MAPARSSLLRSACAINSLSFTDPNPRHQSLAGHADTAVSAWPASDWWRGFGSVKLNELIAQAERSNDDLAGAIARVQEADAQARIAGAALLPSLDLGAAATRERAQVSGTGPRLFNVFNPEL